MELHDRLLQLRIEKKMTQKQVAKKIGVSHQLISMWELGKSKPSSERLKLLSEIYGVKVDYLVNGVPVDLETPTSHEAMNEEKCEASLELLKISETQEKHIAEKHKLNHKTVLLCVIIVAVIVAAVVLWGVVNNTIATALSYIEMAIIILLVYCAIRAMFYIAKYFKEVCESKSKRIK